MTVFSLGDGFNTVGNEIANRAIAFQQGANSITVKNQVSRIQATMLESLSELKQQYEGAINLSSPLGSLSDVKTGLSRIRQKTPNEIYYKIEIVYIERSEILKTPYVLRKFHPDSLGSERDENQPCEEIRVGFSDLLDQGEMEPEDLLKKDLSQFYHQYGDSFINQIDYGHSFLLIIQFSFSNREQRANFKAKLSASHTNVGSSLFKVLKTVKNLPYQAHYFFSGMKSHQNIYTSLDDVEEAFNYCQNPDNRGNPAQLFYKTSPYLCATNVPDAVKLEEVIKGAKRIREAIQKVYEQAVACLRAFDFVASNDVSPDLLTNDVNYTVQKKCIDGLNQILTTLKEVEMEIIKFDSDKTSIKGHKRLINTIVETLIEINKLIRQGIANETLIAWIPRKCIHFFSHKKNRADDFELRLPVGTTHISAKFIPDEGVKLKQRGTPSICCGWKKAPVKTKATLYNDQAIPVTKMASGNKYYIKPSRKSFGYMGDADYDVAIYAKRLVELPAMDLHAYFLEEPSKQSASSNVADVRLVEFKERKESDSALSIPLFHQTSESIALE